MFNEVALHKINTIVIVLLLIFLWSVVYKSRGKTQKDQYLLQRLPLSGFEQGVA